MHKTEPKVFLVGETRLVDDQLQAYLTHVGAPEWATNAPSDSEKLIEAMGRLCYCSWKPQLNKNVLKVREGNDTYLKHILETGHGCYDANTDVLTDKGWKAWPKVQITDQLATRTSDGIIQYYKPNKLIHYRHKGPMYRVESQGVDLLVTPDHCMLACQTTTKKGRKKETFELITARELGTRSHAYTKIGRWEVADNPTITGDVLALLGFAIGDGHLSKRGYRLEFHLRRRRKVTYLKNLLGSLGWKLCTNLDKYNIRIPDQYIQLFRRIYTKRREKTIPQELLISCSRAQLKRLLEGLIQSDGTHGRTGDSYDTTSPPLIGQIQQLCLHLGIASNIGYVLTKEDRPTSFGTKTLTRLSILTRALNPEVNKYSKAKGKTYWVEDWEGEVFCADVPNHTLYVRRNGKPVWSGNSVIEHAVLNFIIADVSRVLSHELVRHRAGVAFSQSSGRFIRLTDLGFWLPNEVVADPFLKQLFEETFENLESLQLRMAEYLKLDDCKDFNYKKKMTSAMRRLAPEGRSNDIGFSANMRALRHMIFMRTSRHAEIEIRVVFDKVAQICRERHPNLFSDFSVETVDGVGEWTTPYVKV